MNFTDAVRLNTATGHFDAIHLKAGYDTANIVSWHGSETRGVGPAILVAPSGRCYRRGAERFGWERRSSTPRTHRDGEWLIGYGVGTANYPYYRMPSSAASITLTRDGRATVRIASHEMGMGTATVQAQHAADRLGLPVDAVRFEYGCSSFSRGTIAGGSSQSATIVAAVTAASDALFK